MASRIAGLIRVFLKVQRRAQGKATIASIRKLSVWTERPYHVPSGVRHTKIPCGALTYEWLTPREVTSEQVIFYTHGGGFALPLYNPMRMTTGYLARLAGMRAFVADYRLAPEYPFPAAVEDCAQAYRWLLSETKIRPEQVVFMGESAGGNLVVTTALALRDAGDPLPGGLASICPVFDFEGRGTFYTQLDPMVHPDLCMLQLNAYRGNADPRTPLLSPLYADLRGLPPTLIQTGGDELLRSGVEEFAQRAQEAGVQLDLRVWPGMWHFWHLFVPHLPEARAAMDEIVQFMRARAT